jgi:hypothetical protein
MKYAVIARPPVTGGLRLPLERLEAMGSGSFLGLLPCDLATLSLHEQAVPQQVGLGVVRIVSHSRAPREVGT